jgi:hypothetical protein
MHRPLTSSTNKGACINTLKTIKMKKNKTLISIRRMLLFFMIALFISGFTAIPVDWQLTNLLNIIPAETAMHNWITRVLQGYRYTNTHYPFLLYGYDWLAFAHFVLAILFIGPYRDPVRNIWVVQAGMIACLLVFPAAFIGGTFRGIPFGWQLIDCSFGLVGLAILWPVYRKIKKLEAALPQYSSGDSCLPGNSFTQHKALQNAQ